MLPNHTPASENQKFGKTTCISEPSLGNNKTQTLQERLKQQLPT